MKEEFFVNGPGWVMTQVCGGKPEFKDYVGLFLVLDSSESEEAFLRLCFTSEVSLLRSNGGRTSRYLSQAPMPKQIGEAICLRTKQLWESGDTKRLWRWLQRFTRYTRVYPPYSYDYHPLRSWRQTLGLMIGFWSSMAYLFKKIRLSTPIYPLVNIFVEVSLSFLGLPRKRGSTTVLKDDRIRQSLIDIHPDSWKSDEFVSPGKMVKEFLMLCLDNPALRLELYKVLVERMADQVQGWHIPFYMSDMLEKLFFDCSRRMPTPLKHAVILEYLVEEEKKLSNVEPMSIEQILAEAGREMEVS